MAETSVEPSGTSATVERGGATGLLKVGVSFGHGRGGDGSVLGACPILRFLHLGGLPTGLGRVEVDVTFRNTHSIFADIIQAEIFELNLSKLESRPFAHLCAIPCASDYSDIPRNLWTAFCALSFDPVPKYFIP